MSADRGAGLGGIGGRGGPGMDKVFGGVIVGGALVAVLVMLKDSTTALAIFGVGIALVAAAWGGYALYLSRTRRDSSDRMSRSLASSAAATPGGISSPAKRARLDEIRTSFENGLGKFKAAGKDVYSVPWYLVVGEPGSGKTEAIRHCKVGFPPGLQDPLQGSGGTVNMHWWFTNHGVFLDTAGRLLFEEVEAGASPEWTEFMRLLVKARPNCPINGLLLFIPADALIKDTAEQLELKGSRIAAQLDQVQRTLGVRFPVYVIVSKCDLVNGFREFFDDINDPKLQDQILGWSNPEPLDAPFRPEQVDQDIRDLQERLSRRRSGVLVDPVHSDDPKKRRSEQVDTLFAFPDSLGKLSTRLRRYLELAFVGGEWSAKPLLLRGVYFTSAMREGSALDQELAEALGVSVEKLPEGRVWKRDRSFFLRDVFLEKAFPERGLVTRAANIAKQMRVWRQGALAILAIGAVLVSLLTFLGYRRLDRAIVAPSRFWSGVHRAYIRTGEKPVRDQVFFLPVVERQDDGSYQYIGNKHADALREIPGVSDDHATPGRVLSVLKEEATREVRVPLAFRPIAGLFGDKDGSLLAEQRVAAARVVLEGSWIRPLYAGVQDKLEAQVNAGEWSKGAGNALAALITLDVARNPSTGAPQKPRVGAPDIDAMMSYLLGESVKDAANAQSLAEWLYNPQGGGQPWPSPAISAATAGADARLIDRGVNAFASYWSAWSESPSGSHAQADAGYPALRQIVAALSELDAAEGELLKLASSNNDPAGIAKAWGKRHAEFKASATRVDALRKSAGLKKSTPLSDQCAAQWKVYRELGLRQHDALLGSIRSAGDTSDGAVSRQSWLRVITESRAALEANLAGHAELHESATKLGSKHLGDDDTPACVAKLKLLQAISDRLTSLTSPAAAIDVLRPGQVDEQMDLIEDRLGTQRAELRDAVTITPEDRPYERLFEHTFKAERQRVLLAFFSSPRTKNAETIAQSVRSLAGGADIEQKLPALPLASWAGGELIDARYAINPARQGLRDFVRTHRTLNISDAGEMVLSPEELHAASTGATDAAREYLRAFCTYWSSCGDRLSVSQPTYANLRLALPSASPGVRAGLESLVSQQEAALRLADNARDGWTQLGELPEVESLRSAATRGRAALASLTKLEAAIGAWSRLPADASEAQRLMLGSQSLASQYAPLPAAPGDRDVVSLYASKLWCAAVLALASEQPRGQGAASQPAVPAQADLSPEIVRLGSKFPITGTSSAGMMSAEEVAALTALVAKVGSISVPASSPSSSTSPAVVGDVCIDAALARLSDTVRGMAPPPPPMSGPTLSPEALRIVSAVRAYTGMSCTLTGVDAGRAQSAAQAAGSWQLFADGLPVGQKGEVATGSAQLGSVALPTAASLELRMFSRSGKVAARGSLGDGWKLLQLIERSGVRKDPSGMSWSVSIPVEIDGKALSAHLDLVFTSPLPDAGWQPR